MNYCKNKHQLSLLFWGHKDESLEDFENLPDPGVLAQEIAYDLESALEQFSDIVDSFSEV